MPKPSARAKPDPRAFAYAVLVEVEGGAFADAVVGQRLNESGLEGSDRALATRLVYGVLAHQGTLDHTLDAYSKQPFEDMAQVPRILLRMGLYQLAFLERIPDHAAVDSTVNLARRKAAWSASLVNAILRRVTRDGLAPPPKKPLAKNLAVRFSHPQWLVELWLNELGEEETAALLEANNRPMPTVYRALIDREEAIASVIAQGFEASPSDFAPDAFEVRGYGHFPGIAVSQGEASQLVVDFVGPQPGERILDTCAAPGGKSAYLAAGVGPKGSVVACDSGPNAAQRVQNMSHAAGVENLTFYGCAVADLDTSKVAPGSFDAVLVDAPCSGLGTLREHPEIRWRREPYDVEDLAARQREILEQAAAYVRPGGRLIYSTCTLLRAENDDVVDAFAAKHPDFTEIAASPCEPGSAKLLDKSGRLRTFPHRHDLAGFFAARFVRAS